MHCTDSMSDSKLFTKNKIKNKQKHSFSVEIYIFIGVLSCPQEFLLFES